MEPNSTGTSGTTDTTGSTGATGSTGTTGATGASGAADDREKKIQDEPRDSAHRIWLAGLGDKVGGKVDEKLTETLHRLGVPTRDEIRALTQKVEELNAKIEQLKPRVTPATTTTDAGF